MRDKNGDWTVEEEEKKRIGQDFFTDLYREEDKSEEEISRRI